MKQKRHFIHQAHAGMGMGLSPGQNYPPVTFSLQSTEQIDTFLDEVGGSYTRSTLWGTYDVDGVYRYCIPNIQPIRGARNLANFNTSTHQLTNGTYWPVNNTFVVEAGDEFTLEFQAIDAYIQNQLVFYWSNVGGTQVNFANKVCELRSGGDVFTLKGTTPDGDKLVTRIWAASGSLDSLTLSYYITAIGEIQLRIATNDGTGNVRIKQPQTEFISGRSTETSPDEDAPSNYLENRSTTTFSCTWSRYNNGNTVDEVTGILTEAEGDLITSEIIAAWAPPGTNVLAGSKYRNMGLWSNVSATVTKDQEGLDGYSNTACEITDLSTTSSQSCAEAIAITSGITKYATSIVIMRDATAPYWSMVRLRCRTGGTTVEESVFVNPATGEFNEYISGGRFRVTDIAGSKIEVQIGLDDNNTGNTVLELAVFPSRSSDGLTIDTSISGSIVADWGQIFFDRVWCPMHYVAGDVALPEQPMIIPRANLVSDIQGYALATARYFDDNSTYATTTLVGFLDNLSRLLYTSAPGVNNLRIYDGTNLRAIANVFNGLSKLISWWFDSLMSVGGDGRILGETAYDGAFSNTDMTIGGGSTGNFINGGIQRIDFGFNIAITQAQALGLVTSTEDIIPLGYVKLVDGTGLENIVDENEEQILVPRS